MKRILSFSLALVLCLSLLGGIGLAAPAETIDKVVIQGIEAPQVGKRVETVSSETLCLPVGADYYLPRQTANWKDGKGRSVYGHVFEAGGTYNLTLSIAAADYTHIFSEKTQILLEDIPVGSYCVQVEPMVANSYIQATVTFVLPGTYAPEPIQAIHLLGGEIKDGVRADYAPVMLYNHGYAGAVSWYGDLTPRGEFIGGNTYQLIISVYDYDGVGHVPAEDIIVTYNSRELDALVEVFDKGEVLHITATVTVPELVMVSSVMTYGFYSRYPVEGANAVSYVPDVDLTYPQGKGYYIQEVSEWFRATDKTKLSEEAQFVRGQKYYLDITYRLTDLNAYKFSSAPTFTLHGVPEEYYTAAVISQTNNTITTRYTFTAQRPPAQIISQLNIWDIDTPRPNVKADYGALIFDGGYQVSEVKWYNNTGKHYLYIPNHDQYQGNEYYVEVYLETLEGYEFADALDLEGFINGTKATVVARLTDTTCKVEYHFGPCQMGQLNDIKVWALTAPETGAEADYYAESGDHYYLNKDDTYFDNGIAWWDLTDNCYLIPGDTFLAGHQYQAELYLSPTVGYQFVQGTATVNGQTSDEIYIKEQQAILYCKFPACKVDGKYAITQAALQNVVPPSVGSVPAYTAGISAEGYRLDTLSTGNYTNGICWIDKTLGRELRAIETFQAGHTYQIVCALASRDGYTFTPDLSATVNGQTATVISAYADGCTVGYTFPALPKQSNPFTDLKTGFYYYDAVLWAVENQITNGTSDTTFSPDAGCTRGQVVTFLWRAANCPEPKKAATAFADVIPGAYYDKAVRWAVENGVTNGTSDTTFSPEATCTRGQIVTFLWRYRGSPSVSAVNPFADVTKDAYYYNAVMWAVKNGVTNGTSDTTFSPEATCTRGQVVTFLYRCMK